VLLPLPVAPTRARVRPPPADTLTFFSTEVPGLYSALQRVYSVLDLLKSPLACRRPGRRQDATKAIEDKQSDSQAYVNVDSVIVLH